ncbi:MAG: hypothetical protein RL113_1002 [Pseudomonadota bacterium]|jgi:mono/diheme cytochrome c family protein
MKKALWVPLIFTFFLSAQEDFISHYEYGEMLYANPRGVSCSQCHGENGEGKTIVTYMNGKKILKGADIRQNTLEEMIVSVNSEHQIMPRYYLTDAEIKAIFDYLRKKNKGYLSQKERK